MLHCIWRPQHNQHPALDETWKIWPTFSFPISNHTIPFTYPFKLPSIGKIKLNGSTWSNRWTAGGAKIGGVKGGVTSQLHQLSPDCSPPEIPPHTMTCIKKLHSKKHPDEESEKCYGLRIDIRVKVGWQTQQRWIKYNLVHSLRPESSSSVQNSKSESVACVAWVWRRTNQRGRIEPIRQKLRSKKSKKRQKEDQ